MKLAFAFLLLLILTGPSAFCEAPRPAVVLIRLGAEVEQAEDQIRHMVAAPNGRMYLTGTTTRRQPFDKPACTPMTLPAEAQSFTFVACFDPKAQAVVWSTILPGETIQPTRIAVLADGSTVIAGKQGKAFRSLPNCKREGGVWFDNSQVGLALLSPAGKDLKWAASGSPNQVEITGLAVDARGLIYWTGSPKDQGMASYIQRVDAAGQPVDFPLSCGKPYWSIGLHPSTADLNAPGQYFEHYNKAKNGGFDYDGPGKGYGKITWKLYGFRRGGQLLILPDGDLIVSAALQYRFWVEGGETSPEFDLFLARYRSTGELVWSTNLYRPGDAVQGTDKKPLALAYDAKNDDVILVGAQHGSDNCRLFSKDFDLAGDSGNMMISWVGRLGAKNGALKAGWYFQNNRFGNYHPNGLPSPPKYPKLAGNCLTGVAVAADGSVLVCGASGPKMWTSPNAPVAWPADQEQGGQACLIQLSPGLDAMPLATVIGEGKPASGSIMQTMALDQDGLWLGGRLTRTEGGVLRHAIGLAWIRREHLPAATQPAR